MGSRTARISKRVVDAEPVPLVGEARVWDADLKGFFLRVYASGRRVYALKYRAGRVQRIFTIGTHGSPWTPEQAREAAKDALSRVRDGEDPAVTKKEARKALTVSELIDAYLGDGPTTKPGKRESTWAIDASGLKRHVRPLIGRKVANTISKADAARVVRDVAEGKTAIDERTGPRGRARVTGGEAIARRVRTTAAAMFAWGIEHDLVATNPFVSVMLSSAPVRERFLTHEEAGRFLDALTELEADQSISNAFADALRLLLLTGARKTEVLGLKWSEVREERRMLVLPPERTKAGGKTGERRISLSPPALQILANRRQTSHPSVPFVFPAVRGEGHAIGVRRAFLRACVEAKLSGLRIHDLRHSFASFAVANGASLFLVGKLLGHTSSRTTERYAHLSADSLNDVASAIGLKLTVPLNTKVDSVVIPLKVAGNG